MKNKEYIHVKRNKDGTYYVMHSVDSDINGNGQILKNKMKEDDAIEYGIKLAKKWKAELKTHDNLKEELNRMNNLYGYPNRNTN